MLDQALGGDDRRTAQDIYKEARLLDPWPGEDRGQVRRAGK
jgi:hypothetical protein